MIAWAPFLKKDLAGMEGIGSGVLGEVPFLLNRN
jgi:hypothetical protein